jgi:hypothetical protein
MYHPDGERIGIQKSKTPANSEKDCENPVFQVDKPF